ncbi:hypothetical protein [Steroidobacter cummioxidans]|uniref:hypothetical protein n=1 Tax=Steroidobacter cummioxidans TaxID=1803913 RepID=UPI000E3204D3|nr:hypothetical protein [Steroidobacter cummioxidans]
MALTPGLVLYLWFPITKPTPKKKFAVLGPIEPKPMLLFIDSDINPYVNNTDDLRAHHIVMDVLNHCFLEYDSWVDCTYPVGYDLEQLISAVEKDPTAIRGTISNHLRHSLCSCIASSKLWPPAKAKRFIDALEQPTTFNF